MRGNAGAPCDAIRGDLLFEGAIASMRNVNDDLAGGLMQTWYRLREQSAGTTKDEALRQAQLALLNGAQKPTAGQSEPDRGAIANRTAVARKTPGDWSHPYYWAPFILIGNWK